MTWTSTRPSKEGWYWYRQPEQADEVVHCDIDLVNHPRTRLYARGEETYGYVDMLDGQWSSEPLVPPTGEAT